MAQTLALGGMAPGFSGLLGTDGNRYSLSSFSGKPILVVIFSCNHCPYAQAYEERIVGLQRDYGPKGVQLVMINSNDADSYKEDSYPEMVKRARDKSFNFPYLRDEDQSVVEGYGGSVPRTYLYSTRTGGFGTAAG